MQESWRKAFDRMRGHLKEIERCTAGCMKNCRPRYGSEEYQWFFDIWKLLESCGAELQWLEDRLQREGSRPTETGERLRQQIAREEADYFARKRRPEPAPALRRDPIRVFTALQKKELYLRAGGHCQCCGQPLDSDWHADHIVPHSRGGRTEVINGQALCQPCNLRKSAKVLTVDE